MRVFILGATSAIAHEAAKHFARDRADLFLAARSAAKLEAVANDLKVRGASRVETWLTDLSDTSDHQAMIEAALKAFSGLDMVLIAYGTLGDQKLCERDVAATLRELTTNASSVISLLTLLGNYFE